MSHRPAPYLSTQAAADLWKHRVQNLDRYINGDFEEITALPGATMYLPISADLDALGELDADKSDLDNARVVWRALKGITPSLARENRVWTHLCHGEALVYSRGRWLSKKSKVPLVELVETHFFARTQTMCRDDNALGRLWWTAFVAHRAAPDAPDEALALILKTADIRSNFVERTWMTTRPNVSAALMRAMRSDEWITGAEDNFRETMKALNIEGAGIAFEVLSFDQADKIVLNAVDRAKAALTA